MSFRNWLYNMLFEEGVIDESFDADEFTVDDLLESTELDVEDLQNYRDQFTEHCASTGAEPEYDFDIEV